MTIYFVYKFNNWLSMNYLSGVLQDIQFLYYMNYNISLFFL